MASNASLRKEPVSFSISGALVWKTMSAAIEFDRQLRDRAVEIEEVDAARIPAAEFELSEAEVAEQVPQAFLRVGGFLTKLASEVAGGRCAGALFAVLWRSPPHPDPLPRWGRGNFARVVVIAHGHRL